MSYLSGKDGKITYNGVQLAKVGSWSLSAQVEALEVTSLADTARDYTPGLKSASGSCSVWYYNDAPVSLLSKVVRTDAPTDADKLTMVLGFGAKAITFTCLLTGAELAMTVGEVMQAQLSFQVCGDLTGVVL
ncbi:MAG: hypothetical protein ACO23G_12770 [Limnohabitans sp.]